MNKIKGSSNAVKMKYLLFVFATAVLVSLPTRVYQLLALVDPSNGFFKESDITIPVLYAVVVVFGLLFLILSFVSKEVPSPKLPTGKNPVLGVASFIMTAGLGWDMFRTIGEIIPVNQGNAGVFISLLRNNLAQEGGVFTILKFVFAFFAMIYFIVFAISHLNGKASYKEFKLLALAPLCWSMTILVTKLMNAISFIKVSELLFEIFMFVFVMLFLLTFARISSGVFTEDSMWGIYGYGLTASLLIALVTIPRIVIGFVGLEAVEGYDFDLAHMAVLVFILAYIFASLGVGFKDGLKNRKQVSEIEMPDDEIIVKKEELGEFFQEEEAIILEETIEPLESFEESFAEISEETVEELTEEVVEESVAVSEDTVEKVVEESAEEFVEVSGEEVIETPKEIVVEEEFFEVTVEETTEEQVEEIEAPEEVIEEVAEIVVEGPKATAYETLDYSQTAPIEETEKKKTKIFRKRPKKKDFPSRSDAPNSELTPISLADLKNKNNE